MAEREYTDIAIGDVGTQVFWFNKENGETGAFEYAFPVTAGAEFGGDTETFDAGETDLDYIPKVGGRPSLNDVQYTLNYTSEKYSRVEEVTDPIDAQIYMEIFQDGSAAIFEGTSGTPTITAGDVRQITVTIAPSFLAVISNIYDLTNKDIEKLAGLQADLEGLKLYDDSTKKLVIDTTSIPAQRAKYKASKTSTAAASEGTEE